MEKIIAALRAVCGVPVYAEWTDDLGECVVYTFHTYLSDRISERVRLQATVITATMARGLEIEARIKAALLTLGDRPFGGMVKAVALNGGGILQDAAREKLHRILTFEIIIKYRE